MITGSLENWQQLTASLPWLADGFAVCEKNTGGSIDSGRHVIDGDRIFVDVHRYTTMAVEDGAFEAHQRYADIQYVVQGSEQHAVLAPDGLTEKQPYIQENDAQLYLQPENKNYDLFTVGAGEFAVYLPEDAHMPGRSPAEGPSEVTKLVVKVLIP